MRKLFKIFLIIILILGVFSLFTLLSPYPTVWLTRYIFSKSSYTSHKDLDVVRENIEIIQDVNYPSNYSNNTLDIIYPKNASDETFPVIFWIHGGAFISGDKSDVTNYMIMLANEGFVIVNINYTLAPKFKYPAPIVQLDEAYSFIENSTDYPFINKDQIYFGGDSAGAHIVAQFILIQTNDEYVNTINKISETRNINKVVNKEIRGVILFCGPYDFEALSNLVKGQTANSTNKKIISIISFFAKRIGFAYLGDLNWKNKDKYKVLSIPEYVTSSFPPAFLTDDASFLLKTMQKN